jgi:hypothetical protein
VTASTPDDREARFEALAEPMLAQAGVTRSTMMGLPCLRIDGQFFGSFDRLTGALLVKLPRGAGRTARGCRAGARVRPGGPAVPGMGGHQPHPTAELASVARGGPRLRRRAASGAEEASVSAFAAKVHEP